MLSVLRAAGILLLILVLMAVANGAAAALPDRAHASTRINLPESVLLEPMNHQYQAEDNCGPASIAVLLSYYDFWISQYDVNEYVSPRPSACDIVGYVSDHYERGARFRSGYGVNLSPITASLYRYSTDSDSDKTMPMKLLLANGIPFIVLQRIEPGSDYGHYRTIHGYDDAEGVFISDDTLMGAGYKIPYDDLGKYLYPRYRSRIFIPVYPLDKDSIVKELLSDTGAKQMYNCGLR